MNYLDRPFAWLLALLFLVVGCHSSVEPVAEPETVPAAVTEAPSPAAAVPTVVAPGGPESSADPTPDLANSKQTTSQAAPFTPPFPDRLELFEAPKRAQSTVKRDDEHGATVELKGFINVDEPRVVLSIDGVVSPVAEGGEKYGVQVISIQPPSVVLQRGRNRWTATLE
jgi:hypothetical protein